MTSTGIAGDIPPPYIDGEAPSQLILLPAALQEMRGMQEVGCVVLSISLHIVNHHGGKAYVKVTVKLEDKFELIEGVFDLPG